MERDFLEQTRVKEGKLLHAQKVVSEMESILALFNQQDMQKVAAPTSLPSPPNPLAIVLSILIVFDAVHHRSPLPPFPPPQFWQY